MKKEIYLFGLIVTFGLLLDKPVLADEIYGVDKVTKRMIDIYAPCDLQTLLRGAGLTNADHSPITVPECTNGSMTKFIIVAVSGTLEEGFPLRGNLDFNEDGETVNAIFFGLGANSWVARKPGH